MLEVRRKYTKNAVAREFPLRRFAKIVDVSRFVVSGTLMTRTEKFVVKSKCNPSKNGVEAIRRFTQNRSFKKANSDNRNHVAAGRES